jgi:hypothetical protein
MEALKYEVSNCRALTRSMNVSYVLTHERLGSFCLSVSCLFCEFWYYFYVDI